MRAAVLVGIVTRVPCGCGPPRKAEVAHVDLASVAICRDRTSWWQSAEAGASGGLTPLDQLRKLEDLVAHPHYEVEVNAELLFRLGDLRCGIGDNAGAVAALTRHVDRYPDYVHADRALLTLAVALERRGDVESAVAQYQAFIGSFPTSYLVAEADEALRRLGDLPATPHVP